MYLTDKEISNYAFEVLGAYAGFDFTKVVENIISRIDFDEVNDDNISDIVLDEIDNALIYYDDEWTVAREYVNSPQELCEKGWDAIFEEFYNDVYSVASAVYEDIKSGNAD